MEEKNQVDELLKKLDQLMHQQEQMQNELHQLRLSAYKLKAQEASKQTVEPSVVQPVTPKIELPVIEKAVVVEELKTIPVLPAKPKVKTPLEEFIGTNLLNKIGIAILVLGISYGVKYSIDHELINPVTRIVLGYAAGIIMVLIAFRLKAKYKTFSAVILSGGMASLYFITYAAYDFYELMPQGLAFGVMVLFTAFTVFASLQYDEKVIAIIGLVGAYGVPFLLSNGSGKVIILFSYIAIVNFGILALAFRKAWKSVYYTAFALTWIIFAAWFFDQFAVDKYLWASLIFATIFFITFYTIFLAYKLIQSEPFKAIDVAILLANSFIYFGFGYAAISKHGNGDLFLGLFTLFNAILHFVACVFVFKRREATRETFYLVAGMVMVFITMAVPIQLEGNWVTLIWAAESLLLFWIGRTKSFPIFERLSYALILLTVGSLFDDWKNYNKYSKDQAVYFIRMFLNVQFLSSMLVLVAFGAILKLNFNKEYKAPTEKELPVFSWALASIALLILYLGIYKEIFTYWQQLFINSEVTVYSGHGYDSYPIFDFDMIHFKTMWLLIYSAIFGIALSLTNRRFIKNESLMVACTIFNALVLFLFVVKGLVSLAGLRVSYLQQTDVRFYFRDFRNILIRYASYLFILPLVWINRQHMKNEIFKLNIRKAEIALLHIFILVVLSSELVNLLELSHVHESFKLGLSILWGAYALMLIVIGLKQQSKQLRVMAIVLFSVTILKLFIYDMANMSTIAKTIVMIILGILMLTASFLYNKVKKTAQNEE